MPEIAGALRHRSRGDRYRGQQPPALGPLRRQHDSEKWLAVPAFPRARYFASRPEWEHAHERHIRDSVSYNDAELRSAGRFGTDGAGGRRARSRARRPHAAGARAQSRHVRGDRGEPAAARSASSPTWSRPSPTCSRPGSRRSISSLCRPSTPSWSGSRRQREKEWICGFGHDASIGFARITPDPKARFTGHPIEIAAPHPSH